MLYSAHLYSPFSSQSPPVQPLINPSSLSYTATAGAAANKQGNGRVGGGGGRGATRRPAAGGRGGGRGGGGGGRGGGGAVQGLKISFKAADLGKTTDKNVVAQIKAALGKSTSGGGRGARGRGGR